MSITNIEFVDKRDWEIYNEELNKLGLTQEDLGKRKTLAVELASGIKGDEYKQALEEYNRLRILLKKATLQAVSRILMLRAEELE